MNETLKSRLVRMLADVHICQVDIAYKCKTKDGMIYTMDKTEFCREDCPFANEGGYADWVEGVATGQLLETMENVQDGNGFYFSCHENVAIRKDEIIRMWVDIDCAHYDDGAEII